MNIIGRLTRDAKVQTLPSDKQVVNFSVAVNDSYRNKQGERVDLTEYFDCAYWISPKVADVLTKGTLVELTGRVSARAWLAGDGNPRASLNFHTSNIKLFGSGKRGETAAGGTPSASTAASQKSTNGKAAKENDDLPF